VRRSGRAAARRAGPSAAADTSEVSVDLMSVDVSDIRRDQTVETETTAARDQVLARPRLTPTDSARLRDRRRKQDRNCGREIDVEMKGLRKILRVSWTSKKTNEWVLNKP